LAALQLRRSHNDTRGQILARGEIRCRYWRGKRHRARNRDSICGSGAKVACVDLDKAATTATATTIGSAAFAVVCDVSNESEVEAAANAILTRSPEVHILVNGAAGHDPNGSVLELSLADSDNSKFKH
jgi:hypothetical protein